MNSDALISSFTEVISGLTSQITELQDLDSLGLLSYDEDGENRTPNISKAQNPIILKSLTSLHTLITDLEDKADTIELVLDDERNAVDELIRVRDKARVSNVGLKGAVSHLNGVNPVLVSAPATAIENDDVKKTAVSIADVETESTRTQSKAQYGINFAQVTPKEFNEIPKSIRGRITLHALNDAITSILTLTKKKYKLLNPTQSKNAKIKQKRQSTHSNPAIITHNAIETDDHKGHVWISEQDLRDNCSFFRGGESTARGVISVLRGLKKMKQVQGHEAVVTYLLLK